MIRVNLARYDPRYDRWLTHGSSTWLNLKNDKDRQWYDQMKYMIQYKIPLTELQEELIAIYKQREHEYFQSR